MSIFSRLTEKSWQDPGLHCSGHPEDYRPGAATVGLYVYLGVASVLFLLIAAAYVMRMGMHGLMDHGTTELVASGDWRPLPEPLLLWVNSAILAASSIAWEAARRATLTLERERMWRMALAGAMLGLAFLVGQLLLWRQYQLAGYYPAASPANAFFYLVTAVHGLHLAGGIGACAYAFAKPGSAADPSGAFRNIRLCAVYWHFLLLVWALLVALLVST